MLDEEGTGGGSVLGHGLTTAMHISRQLKSGRKFTQLMTTNYEVLLKEIHCLHPIHEQLKVVPMGGAYCGDL